MSPTYRILRISAPKDSDETLIRDMLDILYYRYILVRHFSNVIRNPSRNIAPRHYLTGANLADTKRGKRDTINYVTFLIDKSLIRSPKEHHPSSVGRIKLLLSLISDARS